MKYLLIFAVMLVFNILVLPFIMGEVSLAAAVLGAWSGTFIFALMEKFNIP